MEEKAAPALSTAGQQALAKLWGLASERTAFTAIKQSENHTYLVTEDAPLRGDESSPEAQKRRFVLRLTPEDHRSRGAIEAELEFILLIKRSGVSVTVCAPIPLAAACAREIVGAVAAYADDPREWYAVLFEHAEGGCGTDQWRGLRDYGVIEAWGRALGEMHRAIAMKGGDPHAWARMQAHVPQWTQTHGGAADIATIRARAAAGHETSQLLVHAWDERVAPFLASLGEPNDDVYGVVHGDLNVSNFFATTTAADEGEGSLPRIFVFDFDQVHFNWFGFELGVVLQGVQFFTDTGIGVPIDGFDGERFTKVFLDAYRETFPPMVRAGHLEPARLEGFQLYREFYQTSVAVDILFQAAQGRHFEGMITGFCQVLADRFKRIRHIYYSE